MRLLVIAILLNCFSVLGLEITDYYKTKLIDAQLSRQEKRIQELEEKLTGFSL